MFILRVRCKFYKKKIIKENIFANFKVLGLSILNSKLTLRVSCQ